MMADRRGPPREAHRRLRRTAVREEALRWIVHFVADLHQPLHVVGEDRGGNDVRLVFRGHQTNLRRLWDGDLIDAVYPNAVALHKPVKAVLQTAPWQAWESSGAAEWAVETHRVAQESVYLFPHNREIDDRYDRYLEKALPVIYEQLSKATVRLAWVLNRALGRN